MPFHLPPISRRKFLAGSVAAAAACIVGRRSWAADSAKIDSSRVALWSDTHLSADKTKVNKDVNMWDYFQKSSADMLGQEKLPSMVLVNGDLAFDAGLPGDYDLFFDGIKKFREAGLPIHLNMGNHDNRENFWKALPAAEASKVVEGKHVSVVESPAVDWVMLDSLETTKQTPGLLGAAQLAWLGKVLDARKEKPTIVIVHHNPQFPAAAKPVGAASRAAQGAASGGAAAAAGSPARLAGPTAAEAAAAKILPKTAGLKDTKQLLELLLPRKQVKALIFGHTHKFVKAEDDGLHLINLPPVSYPFAKADPSGWVDCTLKQGAMALKLHSVDPKHPQAGEVWDLKWR